MKICIIILATKKYIEFIPNLSRQIKKYFLPNHQTDIIVFTDNQHKSLDVNYVLIDHLEFPYMMLLRYRLIYSNSELFKDYDYLYYMDADTQINSLIGEEIFADYLAVIHPGYFSTPREYFPYEENHHSTAYIGPNHGSKYVCGGFQGGAKYLEACKILATNTTTDLKGRIVARWYDESHWNHYCNMVVKPKVLDPSYMWDLNKGTCPFGPPKIQIIKKDPSFANLNPASVRRGIEF